MVVAVAPFGVLAYCVISGALTADPQTNVWGVTVIAPLVMTNWSVDASRRERVVDARTTVSEPLLAPKKRALELSASTAEMSAELAAFLKRMPTLFGSRIIPAPATLSPSR